MISHSSEKLFVVQCGLLVVETAMNVMWRWEGEEGEKGGGREGREEGEGGRGGAVFDVSISFQWSLKM